MNKYMILGGGGSFAIHTALFGKKRRYKKNNKCW